MQHTLFFREFLRTFHTTGAVLPSGRFLSMALTRYVRQSQAAGKPRRILEVGPGTGAVTSHIIAALGPDDRLDLVELNDRFVACLRQRADEDPRWRPVAGQIAIHHAPVQQLAADEPYDLIISGLPLNNFSVALVDELLAAMQRLLRQDGTLSFFEYIAIRRIRALTSGRAERARLRGIDRSMSGLLDHGEIHRDAVWLNVLPAWVHHVRPHDRDGAACG